MNKERNENRETPQAHALNVDRTSLCSKEKIKAEQYEKSRLDVNRNTRQRQDMPTGGPIVIGLDAVKRHDAFKEGSPNRPG